MDFKPGDFFLGIVDFLGILVPGGALVFLEAEWLRRVFGVSPLLAHWLVFAGAAYFLGHLLLASTETFNLVAKRVAQKTWYLKKIQKEADHFRSRCLPILGNAVGNDAGTAFHAALSFLRIKNGDAAAELDRHMAGYKLLRCLVAVFLLDLLFSFASWPQTEIRTAIDLVLIVLFFLAFVRMLQWAHLLAFQYCILVHEQK